MKYILYIKKKNMWWIFEDESGNIFFVNRKVRRWPHSPFTSVIKAFGPFGTVEIIKELKKLSRSWKVFCTTFFWNGYTLLIVNINWVIYLHYKWNNNNKYHVGQNSLLSDEINYVVGKAYSE